MRGSMILVCVEVILGRNRGFDRTNFSIQQNLRQNDIDTTLDE
jgi:hypothetical protein